MHQRPADYQLVDCRDCNGCLDCRSYEEEQLAKIFTTVGVYANWRTLGTTGYVINGVIGKNLNLHVEYNQSFRPGRALFVDGVCHNQGYLSGEDVKDWVDRLKDSKYKLTKDTVPYK